MASNDPRAQALEDAIATDRGASSLKHRAYVELKRRILSGRLKPGTMLSERQLAIDLKMSKTPVHAALERLDADGLVTVAAQQGIVVREASPREIGDHFEIREALEPFVCARLAGRMTSAQSRRLQTNLREHLKVVRAVDVEANVRLDSEFHHLLCDFLGNGEIVRVMAQIREKVHAAIFRITTRQPERMAVSLAEHRGVADALIAGDGPTAAERMTAHLRYGLRSLYDRQP